MEDLSLHILDIAQNSIRAGATKIQIDVDEDAAANRLRFVIVDDGCGMTEEQLAKLHDPFFTTRSTRRVGLGIPLLKQGAEQAGGGVTITSRPGVGTTVEACYELDNIDRPPLGDLAATVWTLLILNENVLFEYRHTRGGREFEVSTAQLRHNLGTRKFSTPKLAAALRQFIADGETRLAAA
jgi:hypothetical protein